MRKFRIAQVALMVSAFLLLNSCMMNRGDYADLVDPMVGTGDHGHTYPGAVLPFGMVQLSPDTRMENWDGSSGYHYSDSTILGFSHTHLSGTGAPEFCDVLFMPTVGDIQINPGDEHDSKTGYRSAFDHRNEHATPGYYKVLLDDYGVTAELTATKRSGFHRYTFPETEHANVIIDLWHRGRVETADVHIPSDTVVYGLTKSNGWAVEQYIYFYAKFSKPFSHYGIAVNDSLVDGLNDARGKSVKAYFRFNTGNDEQILVKVGISPVSVEGAKQNLEAENPEWDFEKVKEKARAAWNKYLSKIEVEGGTEKERRIFYTAMYHAALAPNLFMDVDGKFRGVDHKVHRAMDFTNYTVFSLWDVFRAQMPLFTIIEPRRMNDFIRSFLEMYRISGRLPRWEIQGTLSAHMIGYHALPVILDAYNKGIRDYDVNLAYEGMKKAMENIPYYNNFGYIPADIEGVGGTVSIVVEDAYNDWCVAEMAKNLDKNEDYLLYQKRAQFYKNIFDPATGFMRARNQDHSWVEPFDPAEPSGHYVEGNAYQYSAFVPHDINGLITLLGGDRKFITWLDTLFTHKSKYDKNVLDASGLIGQYAHGNEPSHQIAYMYSYAGAAPKTQYYVRKILSSLYDDTPGGLSGNEDCGQMSAWYIFSAMGFYPVLPGKPEYAIGSPLFDKVTIHLNNGKQFVIRAKYVSDKNIYVQSAELNGRPYPKSWLTHDDILKGGEIVFVMGDQPDYEWGTSENDRPSTGKFVPAVSMPYYKILENYFFDTATVVLGCDTKGAQIYYTLGGSEPSVNSQLYTGPFKIRESTVLKFFAKKEGLLPTTTVSVAIEKLEKVPLMHLKDYSDLDLKPGLEYKYYEEHVLSVDELEKFTPKKTGITPYFSIEERENDGLFGFIYSGFIKIPVEGVYTFYLTTNDGGVLYLDGIRFIDTDGPRGATPASRMVRLNAGTYRIEEKYFQMGAGFTNVVQWKGPGIRKEVIPPSVLFHQ